jgi:hypothetical protein
MKHHDDSTILMQINKDVIIGVHENIVLNIKVIEDVLAKKKNKNYKLNIVQ